jgi:potassium/hydrogen antiporter
MGSLLPLSNSSNGRMFFISATSVLLQGTTLPVLAKWLHVRVPEKLKRPLWTLNLPKSA